MGLSDRHTAQPPRPGRALWPIALAVLSLAVLGAAVVVPVLAQDDGWNRIGRARLGDPEANAPYQVDLFTTADDPGRLRPRTEADFRVDLLYRGNSTPVMPGPHLQLFVYLCAPTDGPATCSDSVRESTEVGFNLTDDADGTTDGSYLWTPNGTVFDRSGSWRAAVWIGSQVVNNTASFELLVDVPPRGTGWFEQGARYLFGLEGNVAVRFVVFAGWIALFILITRASTTLARRTFLSPRHVDPTVGRLLSRLIGALVFLLGLAISLWITFRVNFWAGLTALGLLSVALGFGMQNTVANIMGGLSLALDKPFVIGDRIQVGDTWGDVEEVGVRSTRILTTKKEYVIIPNKLMDEREIWNYTKSHQELRVDVDIGISYDSDRRLAEALLIEAAREHSEVLPYPRPRVLLMNFSDSSVTLQLRAWLRQAKDARIVASDLRKAAKDKFDGNGIEIPFPYRTLVQKNDLPVPRVADDTELARYRVPEHGLPRMVYATAGPEPLDTIADLVCHLAAELDMALVVAHVTRPGTARVRASSHAYRIFSAFEDAAVHHNVPLRTAERQGPIVTTLQGLLEDEQADLLAMGSSRHPFFLTSRKVADLTKHVRENVKVPVLIIPRSLRVPDRTIDHYRKLVEERVMGREKPGSIKAEGSRGEPAHDELVLEDNGEDNGAHDDAEARDDDVVENTGEEKRDKT